MHLSHRLLAPGFFRRSLDEVKRFTNIVVNQEGLYTPMTPYKLLDFTDPDTITICKTMSDADLGGFSRVALEQVLQSVTEPAHARFHGSISIELPRNRPQVQRTGYAAWRNHDRGVTLFGKSLWDVDPYAMLALRVKSDGRKYFVNIQTESIVYTDIHQHRLHVRRPGEWETVLIRWSDFVRTNHGEVVEPQKEMLTQKVRTLGIGLIDRVPGPFDLGISAMWATNRPEDREEDANADGNRLKYQIP
ncbi:MAG: hypothetical protein LQ351_006862 [Letrouitia transgressa]|nr:MAG: hypothetical protein LQ351_006862 [Letrouitia transgressa]